MELRRELLAGIGVVALLAVTIAFLAIGVLTRMRPAIARILAENVESIHAAEDMTMVLAATSGGPVGDAGRQRFRDALERARANVTEPDESAVLERLAAAAPGALDGEPGAVRATVDDLERLIRVNRRAMEEVDRRARALGAAGAWSAVFLAVLAFAGSSFVLRRLSRRLLAPLDELYAVLEAARTGNPHRRCRDLDAPRDLRRTFSTVNALLDLRSARRAPDATGEQAAEARGTALRAFLDDAEGAVFVVDAGGEIAAANAAGLDRLAGAAGPAIRRVVSRRAAREGAAGSGGDDEVPGGDRGAPAPAGTAGPGTRRQSGEDGAPAGSAEGGDGTTPAGPEVALEFRALDDEAGWICRLREEPASS